MSLNSAFQSVKSFDPAAWLPPFNNREIFSDQLFIITILPIKFLKRFADHTAMQGGYAGI
jgi:hypothetical protein